MKANTIKQRTIRLVGVSVLTIGMALSTGVAAAMPSQQGLTECEQVGCTVVTSKAAAKRFMADVQLQAGTHGGPLRPHLIP